MNSETDVVRMDKRIRHNYILYPRNHLKKLKTHG